MLKVKAALGKDAVILHTRKFREGGIFGFFGRDLVEVIAAVDDGDFNHSTNKTPSPSLSPILASGPLKVENLEVKKEIAEVKTLLGQMIEELELSTFQGSSYPKYFEQAYRVLRASEVEEKLAHKIIHEALQLLQPEQWQDVTEIHRTLETLIARRLLRPHPIIFKKAGEKKRIAVVGPTGVGKTTTIAKLAAIFAILEKKEVALATVDTYRVAAVDQLKTYAEIIAVPLEVAYTPKELQDALAKHGEKDLILIDTAGRSPLNEVQMAELKAFLEPSSEIEIFLVLGATTKQTDLWDAVARFSQLSIKRLIFTKLDETQSYGVILNVVNRLRKTLAYVTAGQNVPDDIEVPDPVKIAKKILRVKEK
ncbi:MAG: flagellar biosynthesis protein FlhF [Bacillota bacterium]|nr:flagellar biosynthesis protein FlhF [Bacillota bacterium]